MVGTGATSPCAVGEDTPVNRIRGIVMLLAAAVAAWKGWQFHLGERALIAYGLAVLALSLGVWHLWRQEPTRVGPVGHDGTPGKPAPGNRL